MKLSAHLTALPRKSVSSRYKGDGWTRVPLQRQAAAGAWVELDAGTYMVDFVPLDDQTAFVWGDGKFSVMFKYIFSIFILSVIMLISFAGIILALDKKLKKPLPLE